METVKAFNAELSALYEVKPPISKAKMTSITRSAIKAIKFYKHVVQSVEKFILKCKPEYKIPGLYVIDSIVRQSRHQFGADKDVFAPRFAKNMQQTFVNLFKCPPEDKSRIIRVLNLWQKNQVFAPDVVQPLFDLADPNNPIHKELGTPIQSNGINMPKGSPAIQKTPTKTAQGYDGTQGGPNLNLADPNVLLQLQQLQRLMTRGESKQDGPVHFDKKLLDFDYGDDEDDANSSPKNTTGNVANDSVTSLLTNPEVLRQLQTLQQTMALAQDALQDPDKIRKLQEMKQQEDEFDKHLAQTVPNLPFASECEFKPIVQTSNPGYYMQSVPDMNQSANNFKNQYEPENASQDFGSGKDNDVEVITLDHSDSRSPSPRDDRYSSSRRRRSRSRSRDRRDRRSRRSRSRSRRRRSRSRDYRDKDRDKKEKETEKDRERKKRGLPAIKPDNLSVCSTTLWVGHLSKLVHQDDLSNTFGEYGDIVSIDLIPPRGCAFIVMHRRQDAAKCLVKLKNHIIHGKAMTLAWAPGKGVKGKDLKDYWEGDLGVSYIPWSKLKRDMDLELLEDGGMIDEDTMPDWMKEKIAGTESQKVAMLQQVQQLAPMPMIDATKMTVDTSQPPPMAGGLLQPPMMVPPFQFNLNSNRLLAPPNLMNMMTGMPPPMGVPPPNMQPPLLANQLLGMGSPFQGPPGLLPPPPITLPTDAGNPENNMKSLTDSMLTLSQGFNPTQHFNQPEDSMDVEMELDDKNERDNGKSNNDRDDGRIRDRRDRDRDRDRDRRGRSRDKDRDRDRNRDRDRRSRDRSKDWDRDRDRKNDRGRDRRDDRRDDRRERDRGNRWGDRDRGNREVSGDRRDRERTLNERLQEMANMGSIRNSRDVKEPTNQFSNKNPPSADNSNVFGNNAVNDSVETDPIKVNLMEENKVEELKFEPPPGVPQDDNFPIVGEFPPGGNEFGAPVEGINMGENFYPEDEGGFPLELRDNFYPPGPNGPRGNFRRGPMNNFRGPVDNFPAEQPGDFPIREFPPQGPIGEFGPQEGPFPPMMDEFGPPLRDGPPFRRHEGFRGRGRNFRGGPPRGPPDGEFFDPRGEGFMPPRDGFGPPIRGGFGSRGRGMRHPGPPGKFFRGGPRGRGGSWNDRNFNPRFDGPPEFFRGPPGVEEEDLPPNRGRRPFGRRDERRPSFERDRNDSVESKNPASTEDPDKPGRKSRWGNDDQTEAQQIEEQPFENPPDIAGNGTMENTEHCQEDIGPPGNQTPLHDEGPPGVDESFASESCGNIDTVEEAPAAEVEAEA